MKEEWPMNTDSGNRGQRVYDPRGVVAAEPRPVAPRVAALEGLRLGVLDNTKWNAGRLLGSAVAALEARYDLAAVNTYRKESFARNATPALLDRIAAENDVVLTAVGD